MARILLIEDDVSLGPTLQDLLGRENHRVDLAVNPEQGLGQAKRGHYDVVVTDLHLAGPTLRTAEGHELIRQLHGAKPLLPIILMTGDEEAEHAIKAIRLGAYDYVLKNEDLLAVLSSMINEAVVATRLMFKATKASGATPSDPVQQEMVGRSPAMQKVYKSIGHVAAKPVTVLVRGETGTGKELVARALQHHGDREDKPFVIVNCVAIPEALLESELFGHEPGAFTGAQARRVGKFEQANYGTIFLDEIGDMSLSTQAKLLRVLQEKTIQRVGGKETIPVDVRVIAATHRDLERAVGEKQFRADLYYRLNDAVIRLPPLRERREDIPDLVQHFLRQHGSQQIVTAEALRALKYRPWPGNVRELKNAVHKAILLARGYPIDPQIVRTALGETILTPDESMQTLQAHVSDLLERADREGGADVEAALTAWAERQLYAQAIRLAEGDQTQVAKWLGVSRPTVRERLLRFHLRPLVETSFKVQSPKE